MSIKPDFVLGAQMNNDKSNKCAMILQFYSNTKACFFFAER